MPKMKSNSSAKKRFSLTKTGKVKSKRAFTSHMMRNKSQKAKRNLRGTKVLAEADQKKVLDFLLPYARKKKKK